MAANPVPGTKEWPGGAESVHSPGGALLSARAESARPPILHASPAVRPPGDRPPLPVEQDWRFPNPLISRVRISFFVGSAVFF
jgi:hypothetical protein